MYLLTVLLNIIIINFILFSVFMQEVIQVHLWTMNQDLKIFVFLSSAAQHTALIFMHSSSRTFLSINFQMSLFPLVKHQHALKLSNLLVWKCALTHVPAKYLHVRKYNFALIVRTSIACIINGTTFELRVGDI